MPVTIKKVKYHRLIDVGGETLAVPPYIYRGATGWQLRIRNSNLPSHYFSDCNYGGPAGALAVAVETLEEQLAELSV